MTTFNDTFTLTLNGHTARILLSALIVTAHVSKDSRDNENETPEAKAHDQRTIDRAHKLIGDIALAAGKVGPVFASALLDFANHGWGALVGEDPQPENALPDLLPNGEPAEYPDQLATEEAKAARE